MMPVRWQTLALLAFFGWATLLALGSWYPFRFQSATFDGAFSSWWRGLRFAGQSQSDLAVNLIAGIPLGFCSGLLVFNAHRLSGLSTVSKWLMSLVVILGISLFAFAIEIGQAWFGGRVPSQFDTVAQSMGAIGGFLFARMRGPWIVKRVSNLLTGGRDSNPFDSALDLYVGAYVLWMLMPFIPSVSPSELKRKWLTGVSAMSLDLIASDPWKFVYQAFAAAMSAFPVGVWWMRRLSNRTGHSSWIGAMTWGCLSVICLEFSQLFIQSRVVGVDDAIWSSLGVIVGVAVANAWARSTKNGSINGSNWSMGIEARLGLLAFCSLGYLAASIAPFDLITSSAELRDRVDALERIFTGGILGGNDWSMFSNSLRACFYTMPLGCLIAFANRTERGDRISAVACMALIGLIAIMSETLQLLSRQHQPDLVGVVAKWVGGGLGYWIFMLLARHGERRS
jgi:VanZ family protein